MRGFRVLGRRRGVLDLEYQEAKERQTSGKQNGNHGKRKL
jgi:hypothetical protein